MLELWISVGRHRKETAWKNKKYTWLELLDRLKQCQYTGETVKEYHAMDKDQQAPIKDVGGFVGGVINGGRRKKGAITSRSLLTLDLDSAPVDFWDELTLFNGYTCCVYSTHKHTPKDPRLRLIIPLDREVLPDEYEAIGRKVAADIGIEYFDPTTFQPERLMYWPSMPKDGEYLFESQEGRIMSADKVLAGYKDWKDTSQWPMHTAEIKAVREGLKMAADPLGKPGIVGAFCRAYGIEAAITEFLSDLYVPAGEDRYTYTGGSTAAGLVVYDDKFAYSHHGTDPCSGILCNAFDLVRIHKFGRLDDRCKEDTPIQKRPSFKAMADMGRLNGDVNLDLVKQQTGKAQEAFAEEIAAGGADEWLKTLETDRQGKIQATAENIMIILRNDPGLSSRFAWNLFTCRGMVRGRVPWDEREIERLWEDADDAGLRWYVETTYRFTAVNKLYDCLTLIMRGNSYHPVREYLEGLVWDGIERIDRLLIDYFGAVDSEYTKAVMRKCLIAGVARIMEPGIKYDTALTLVGPQGSGKSTFIKKLGAGWYSDNFGKLGDKSAIENIQGVWIMEIGELAALKKAEIEVIKHFISNDEDQFRPAYGRYVMKYPRQCIFIGSTNDEKFMQDPTGGRRFWPVVVGYGAEKVFKRLTRQEVKQIWAEAVKGWAEGEDLHLDYETEKQARQAQDDHTEHDPRTELILENLDKLLPVDWQKMSTFDRRVWFKGDDSLIEKEGKIERIKVTVAEIWYEIIGGTDRDMNTRNVRFIHDILKRSGKWEKKGMARSTHYGAQHTYVRVDCDI